MPELGAPPPLTERVATLVRAQPTGLALDEIQEALPEVDPKEVRAALNALRRGRFLDAILEGSTLIYRSPESRPQRVEGSSLESKVLRRAARATAASLPGPVQAIAKSAAPKAAPPINQIQEAVMPKGVYERKPKKESKSKTPARRAKPARAPRAPVAAAPARPAPLPVGALEIFADGTVHLRGKADQLGRIFEVISQLRAG